MPHPSRSPGLVFALLGPLALLLLGCGGDGGLVWTGVPGSAPMTLLDWTPEVEVSLDGVVHPMVLDTGAPFTAIDRDAFPGRVDGLAPADVALLGIEAPGLEVSTFDLFGAGGPVDGLLGADVLATFALEVDYRGGTAALHVDGALAPAPDDATPVELDARIAGGGLASVPGCGLTCGTRVLDATRVLVRARVEGLADPVWAMIDTGASGVLVRDTLLARLDDAEARVRPRLPGLRVAAVGGVVDGAFVRLWRLALIGAGGRFGGDDDGPSVPLDDVWAMDLPGLGLFEGLSAETDLHVELLIGGSYLRATQLVVDAPREVLRLAPYPTTPHVPVDEFARVGFTLEPAGGLWLVGTVFPGTDAEAEGLFAGDTIDAVAGAPLVGLTAAEVDVLFAAYAPGDVVPLTVTDRSGTAREVGVSVEDLLPSFPPPG